MKKPASNILQDVSLSAVAAGMIVVAVSFGGPAAIIFQAASGAGLIQAQLSSWIWAICTGPEAHPDPAKRYVAGLACGLSYLALGVFGTALVGVFTALPGALIAVASGLALFGAITSGLVQAMSDATRRDAALVTFLITVSGTGFFGIGSASWGLVGGLIADRAFSGKRMSA